VCIDRGDSLSNLIIREVLRVVFRDLRGHASGKENLVVLRFLLASDLSAA
jgi:hypothetical protein